MPSIREWPITTRPRERLLSGGRLSDDELLAVLIGSGRPGHDALALAREALVAIGGLHAFARVDASRLRALRLGAAATARILAGCELGRRTVAAEAARVALDSPAAAARALAPHLAHLERESLVVALLDRKQRLLGIVTVYNGHIAGTSVRIGELFTEAIRRNAAALMLAHNHPSGDPEPSADDIRTTRDAVAAGRLLGVDVVDHLVMGAGRHVSLRERRLMTA
jgi:DNA repair protein RadC